MEGMRELMSAAVAWVNLPYTVLFVAVLLYWLTVVMGILDIDIFNLDVDADMDVDVGVDGGHADVHGGGGAVHATLHFFHVGDVPVAILLSFLFVSMWVGSILANHHLENESMLTALAIFPPNLLAGMLVSKILAMPFAKIFRAMGGKDINQDLKIIGSTCTVVSGSVTKEVGQAEIETAAAPVRLNVRAAKGQSFGKGQRAVIAAYDEKNRVYIIKSLETEE